MRVVEERELTRLHPSWRGAGGRCRKHNKMAKLAEGKAARERAQKQKGGMSNLAEILSQGEQSGAGQGCLCPKVWGAGRSARSSRTTVGC
jgi:hypothetical protein